MSGGSTETRFDISLLFTMLLFARVTSDRVTMLGSRDLHKGVALCIFKACGVREKIAVTISTNSLS